MTGVTYSMFDSMIGLCGVAWGPRGIVAVQLPQHDETQTLKRIMQRCGEIAEAPPPEPVQRAIDAMIDLLKGDKRDLAEVALDLDGVPDFNRSVYDIARTIPPGKTLTYGDIAKKLGGLELAREVGRRSVAIRARSWCRAIACWRPATNRAAFRPMAAW